MGSQGRSQPLALILCFNCFSRTTALSTPPWVSRGALAFLFNMKAMSALQERNKAMNFKEQWSTCTRAKGRRKLC